jgi:hypothetical protein
MLQKRCSFSYICELNWDDLEIKNESATIDDVTFHEIRYCGNCRKNVYKVDTVVQYNKIIERNLCIAVDQLESVEEEIRQTMRRYGRPTLGLPSKPVK